MKRVTDITLWRALTEEKVCVTISSDDGTQRFLLSDAKGTEIARLIGNPPMFEPLYSNVVFRPFLAGTPGWEAIIFSLEAQQDAAKILTKITAGIEEV